MTWQHVQVAIFVFALASLSLNSSAHEFERFVNLNGSSGATGSGIITFDLDLVTMRVQLQFSGLSSNTLTSHIHATTSAPLNGVAPIATVDFFAGLTGAGLTSGSFDHTFDLTTADSYNAVFITNSGGMVSDALNKLIFAAEDEKSYLSIKTVAFPTGDGEISGFLTAVPEPSSVGLLGIVSIGMMSCRSLSDRLKPKSRVLQTASFQSVVVYGELKHPRRRGRLSIKRCN